MKFLFMEIVRYENREIMKVVLKDLKGSKSLKTEWGKRNKYNQLGGAFK